MDKTTISFLLPKKVSPPPNIIYQSQPAPPPVFSPAPSPPLPVPLQTPILEPKTFTRNPISSMPSQPVKAFQDVQKKAHQIKIEGILYLDQEQSCRKIRNGSGALNISFNGVQRVGSAKLWIENDVFKIFSGNASFVYLAQTLDQIVFHEVGIALIPNLHYQAAAIFLSEEIEKIKTYMQKNILHSQA